LKIAVTGASGFIGRHVVAELERRSLSPTLIVRPQTTIPAALARHPVVRLDIADPPVNAFDDVGRPEILIHLAWGGLPNYRSPNHVENELPIQYKFLENLIESGLKNCLVTGTCLEYGDQTGRLCEDVEARPIVPYGIAKDTLRRQLAALHEKISFNLTWARLFYSFGDGQSPGSLWPQLRAAVEQGQRQFAMSGGEQLRDYLPVSTVAHDLVSLALTTRDNGIVNVCSGIPISVRQLVETWIDKNGWSIALDLGRYPYADYEPMAFWGTRDKLERVVGSR
jgi:nucleoside-diphosphate-sugar epimerase